MVQGQALMGAAPTNVNTVRKAISLSDLKVRARHSAADLALKLIALCVQGRIPELLFIIANIVESVLPHAEASSCALHPAA
ncbi:hypothetical protein FF32_15755 [Halomonas campaniensis]|nr:hypothetical protein FF32_15755 [Halomonas campaniensis]